MSDAIDVRMPGRSSLGLSETCPDVRPRKTSIWGFRVRMSGRPGGPKTLSAVRTFGREGIGNFRGPVYPPAIFLKSAHASANDVDG